MIPNHNKIITLMAINLYFLLSFVNIVYAGTYWVSSNGTATWANCQSNLPLSGSSACNLATANSNALDGDTIYLRGGTFNITGSGINPAHTGTSGSVITFAAYNGETVNFVGGSSTSTCVNLNSDYGTIRNYIKVKGITCSNFYRHMWILRGSNNEISHSTFVGKYSETDIGNWIGSAMYRNATYNWVHNCTFGNFGYSGAGSDEGVVFEIGNDDVATGDNTHHNLVENNVFYHGGHHVVSIDGYNNVFRNNYVRNDPWSPLSNPIYSNRIIFSVGATDSDVYRNLIEGNRIAYGGETPETDQIGGSGGTIASSYNIIRKNIFYNALIYGLYFTHYSGHTSSKYNHLYNNVFFHNGYSTTGPLKINWNEAYTHGLFINEDATYVHDNVIKNNIFYQNKNSRGLQYSIIRQYPYGFPTLQSISSNWFDNAGDPKFVDISGTPDPTLITSQYDFRLQPDSPCINTGSFLTTITSASGSGTSFTVADAGYFLDGWGIISGDTIQLAGQTQTAVITAINYTTNTITVNTSLSWTNGQGIGLAYNGSGPDMGAYEISLIPPTINYSYTP